MSNLSQRAVDWTGFLLLAATNCEWSPSSDCHLARDSLAQNGYKPSIKRCALCSICDASLARLRCGRSGPLANAPRCAGSTSLHGPIAGTTATQQAQIISTLPDLSTGYHDSWVTHLENQITFGVDGQTLGTLTPADLAPGETWVYNRPVHNDAAVRRWQGRTPTQS